MTPADTDELSNASYLCMPRKAISAGRFSITAVCAKHIEEIRRWRNAQLDVLRQTVPISSGKQAEYFAREIWPDKGVYEPSNILLIFTEDGRPIGYGGLVHISWEYRRAEISFLLDPEPPRQITEFEELFEVFLGLIRTLAFGDLGLQRLTTETFAIRDWVFRALERVGFVREGRLRQHVSVNGASVDSVLHGLLSSDPHPRHHRMQQATRVLVSSASAKVPLVRAMKEAALRLDPGAQVIAGDVDTDALAQHVADDFWIMPRTNDLNLDEILEGCRERGINIVFPTRDGELSFWAKARERFAAAGIEVIVSSPVSVERCIDKLMFARWGIEKRLPVIPAGLTPEAVGSGPYVVKERFGAGSQSIGICLERDAALRHAKGLNSPIYQPYISGPEISIDAWFDRYHHPRGVVLRRRDTVVDGESKVTTTFSDAGLEQYLLRILPILQLRGPVVFQALLDPESTPRLIECNTRFGGASVASIAVGLDSLFWSMLESADPDAEAFFYRQPDEVRQALLTVSHVVHLPEAGTHT